MEATDPVASMSFFGITTLGPTNLFASAKLHAQEVNTFDIQGVPIDAFETKFRERAGADGSLRRTYIPDVIRAAVGRDLLLHEMEALLLTIDIGPGQTDLESFRNSLGKFVARCREAPADAATYRSNLQLHLDRHKHRRSPAEPRDMFQRTLTTNQEYGWQPATVGPKGSRHLARKSTDVTIKEGLCVDSYYGIF